MTLALDDAPATAFKQMTIEEFDRLPDWKRYELVHGKCVERLIGAETAVITATILFSLSSFNRHAKVGHLYSGVAFLLDPEDQNHFRSPSVSFVSNSKCETVGNLQGRLRLAPDLAVDVVSPFDFAEVVQDRVLEYLKSNVRLVWVVYPSTKHISVFRYGSSSFKRLNDADTISGEELLPGYIVGVSEFFNQLPISNLSPPAPQNPQ